MKRRLRRWISSPASKRSAPVTLENERVLANLLTTPDFFPLKYDAQSNMMLFVEMTRESFRQSVFLDDRVVRASSRTLSMGLKQLKLLPVQPERPLHFILHGAACGSTLLARYLEALPHGFVLKEPRLLLQLAGQPNDTSIFDAHESGLWDDWFKLTLVLLQRAYPSDAAVIVKAPDISNWMASFLLDHDRRTKVVFLQSPLKEFLLSVLKIDGRRRWVRQRVEALRGRLVQVRFLSEIVVADLTDGQCGAAFWLFNCFICSLLLARSDSDRIFPLGSATLFNQPQQAVGAVADFFGLTHDEARAAALAQLDSLSYYSKDINRAIPYDIAARMDELGETERRLGGKSKRRLRGRTLSAPGGFRDVPFPSNEIRFWSNQRIHDFG